jgi:hypothetical protein
MPRTKARLFTAGIGAVSLAAGLAFLGVTGQAEAATNLRDVNCYKNPDGAANPDRIHVSRVVVSDPDAGGSHTVTWQLETEVWVDLGKGRRTYTNATRTWSNGTITGADSGWVADAEQSPDFACKKMADGTGDSVYSRGAWA